LIRGVTDLRSKPLKFQLDRTGYPVASGRKTQYSLFLGVLVPALLSAIALPSRGFAETIAEPVALLQGLDKISARVSKFEAPVGTPVRFGTLSIRVRDCEKNPPEEEPESAAFLEIDELRPGEVNLRVFSGWMFASSPALSALEHPVYDVNVLDCKTASGSPPVQSGKEEEKTAR
jgi:hypothetical protein